jgi:hypothetical protein
MISFLLVSCASTKNIDQSKDAKIITPETSGLENEELVIGVLKIAPDGSEIIEIPEIKMFEDDSENTTLNKANLQGTLTKINILSNLKNDFKMVSNNSSVPNYIYGEWKDDITGNSLIVNFDYDFSHIFIKNEVISNRILIFGENSKNIKKNWLGTLDGSIVINKTTGLTNAGKDVVFSSGLNQAGDYFFKIRKDDSGEEYGGLFKYDSKLDKIIVHIIAIDSDKNTSEFDYTLIRSGFPIIAANTFICPNWLKGYNEFSDKYSVSFNNGSFEIKAINSYNQTFDLIFEEFNTKVQSDVVYLNKDNVLIHMYGNEKVKDIDLDFFYKLDDLKSNSNDDIGASHFLTMQIGEKLTGGGGIIQIEFSDKKILNIEIYFLQDDGSFISFF